MSASASAPPNEGYQQDGGIPASQPNFMSAEFNPQFRVAALDTFYNSLTDEQKAAFDAIGPERNGATTGSTEDTDEAPRRRHGGHRHGYSVGGMIFRMMGL